MLGALVALAFAGGALLSRARAGGEADLHGSLVDPPLPSRPFTLASGEGEVSLADLQGRVVALFFGYTSCPDVCPLTLGRLREARTLLGPAAADVQVVFVSVDPERDVPARAATYARRFDPSFLGLSGSPDEIRRVASDYGIFYEKAEGGTDGDYTVDHSAAVLVLDRQGRVRLLWNGRIGPREMADDLAFVIAE
jgi:protein SCO1/2